MKICSVCQNCYEDAVIFCPQENHGELVASRPGSRKISAKYRLDILLERNLTGETYQAMDIPANKSLVIKLIDPNSTGDLMLVRERLNTELRHAVNISHQSVAQVIDYGVLGNNEVYIASELSLGQTLREFLKDNGSLSEATAIIIARQIAEALEAAHSHDVIHRGLSPANICLVLDAQNNLLVKLQNFDFGGILQRVVNADLADAEKPQLEVFRYFSPEQCAAQTADARTDIYSLGVVLYEMLSGESLFDAPTAAAIVNKKINEQLPPLNNLHFDVKALLTHTLLRALNKRPDLRPQTATNFARNLRHLEYITKQSSEFKKFGLNQPTKTATDQPNAEKLLSRSATTSDAILLDNSPIEQQNCELPPLPQIEMPIVKATEAALNTDVLPPIEETFEAETVLSQPVFYSEPIYVQRKNTAAVVSFTSEPILIKRKNVRVSSLANDSIVFKAQDADSVLPTTRLTADALLPAEMAAETSANSAKFDSQNFLEIGGESFQNLPVTKRPLFINAGFIAVLAAFAILSAIIVAAATGFFGQSQTQQATINQSDSASGETVSSLNGAQIERANSNPSKGGVVVSTTEKPTADAAPLERNAKNDLGNEVLTNNIKAKQNAQSKDAAKVKTETAVSTGETSKDTEQPRQIAKEGNPEAELGSSLNKWIEATNSRDVDQQMNYYAPKINSYYLARNASQEAVKAEKKRIFENAAVVDIRASKPEIVLSNDGQTAKMRFHKKYVIKKGQQDRSGEVIQELQWVKSKNGWKIVSERDVKVINR